MRTSIRIAPHTQEISIYVLLLKERFETVGQHSILHPERIVGQFPNDAYLTESAPTTGNAMCRRTTNEGVDT